LGRFDSRVFIPLTTVRGSVFLALGRNALFINRCNIPTTVGIYWPITPLSRRCRIQPQHTVDPAQAPATYVAVTVDACRAQMPHACGGHQPLPGNERCSDVRTRGGRRENRKCKERLPRRSVTRQPRLVSVMSCQYLSRSTPRLRT